MDMPDVTQKGCGSQLLQDDIPHCDWPIDQVIAFAESQHGEMLTSEGAIVVKYWRLGTALNLIRRDVNHGQWQQLLDEMGIEKTRASKARAIASTFDDEWELEGLTVQQAYDCRHKKIRKRKSRVCDNGDLVAFVDFLDQVVERANEFGVWTNVKGQNSLNHKIDAAISALATLQTERS